MKDDFYSLQHKRTNKVFLSPITHPNCLIYAATASASTVGQNQVVLRHQIIPSLTSSRVSEWVSNADQANERAVWANKSMDRVVAKYLRPDSWLSWTTVQLSVRRFKSSTTNFTPLVFMIQLILKSQTVLALSCYTLSICLSVSFLCLWVPVVLSYRLQLDLA